MVKKCKYSTKPQSKRVFVQSNENCNNPRQVIYIEVVELELVKVGGKQNYVSQYPLTVKLTIILAKG